MENMSLAIATVPMQKWGPVYEDKKALATGTIFQDLDMPFFAVNSMEIPQESSVLKSQEQTQCEQLLTKICEVSFVLDDLVLYLDTHGEDVRAIQMYFQKSQEREQLKKRFAEEFYPLTRECAAVCGGMEKFSWLEGPVPWEGGCV